MSDPESAARPTLHQALAELGLACAGAAADEADDLLRAATALFCADGMALAGSSRRDALIAAGGQDALALALVEPRAGYMLSHAPGGRHLATVVPAGQARETSAEGASAALALIGALAMALAGGAGSPVERPQPRGPGLRLN